VFAKNERGNRLTSKNIRWWLLLFLLLSVASIRRKLLKTAYTEERSVHTNSESCNIRLGRKKINLIPNKSFSYCKFATYNNRFEPFVNIWYFIIFFKIFYDPRVTFKNIHSCFDDFWNEDDIFIFSVKTSCKRNINLKK